MKTIVIYYSQTGFTKKYAEWISEALGADCYHYDKAKKMNLAEYDNIIFGSWFCAGGMQKLKWFKEQIPNLDGKKLAVFCVGASPIESPDVEPTIRHCFDDTEWGKIKTFYCPGGLRYDKMHAGYKLMMKMFAKSLAAKKDQTDSEIQMAKMLASSYDLSDKKYINPLMEYINENNCSI